MNCHDIVLPEELEDKIKLYIVINDKINEIWKEYVVFSGMQFHVATTKIFAIIFSEMDFYESLLGRIRVHLSEDDMVELRRHDAIWDW